MAKAKSKKKPEKKTPKKPKKSVTDNLYERMTGNKRLKDLLK